MAQNTKTNNGNTKSKPSHIVWFVPERKGAPWTRIGAMWPTKEGTGYRQALQFFPNAQGNIVVLPNDKSEDGEE